MIRTPSDRAKMRIVMRYVGVIGVVINTACLIGFAFLTNRTFRVELGFDYGWVFVLLCYANMAVIILCVSGLVHNVAAIAGYKRTWLYWTKWED